MRKILPFTIVLFLFTAAASAQVPTKGNVFLGYSYFSSDLSLIDRANLNGWNASLEGRVLPWVGLVGDSSGHYGSQVFGVVCTTQPCPLPIVNANVREHNFLFGPRVSFSAGKFRPFAQALLGVGHVNSNGFGSDTSFATAIGGGLDYRLVRLVGWRVQADYLQTRLFGARNNNVRLSTGLVVHL